MISCRLEASPRNWWLGLYWETWPDPFRRDIWVGIPILCLHIVQQAGD